MSADIILLSRPINFAVVQLPDRSFPGVVIQGDTLNSLVQSLSELLVLIGKMDKDGIADGLVDLKMQLMEALIHYENVCADRGIDLPYKKSSAI